MAPESLNPLKTKTKKECSNIYLCVFLIQLVGKGRKITLLAPYKPSHFSQILAQFLLLLVFSSVWVPFLCLSIKLDATHISPHTSHLTVSLLHDHFFIPIIPTETLFLSPPYCQGVLTWALLYLCIYSLYMNLNIWTMGSLLFLHKFNYTEAIE